MSSRTVAVVLTAQVQNYVDQMKAAEKHTTDVEKAARSATEQFRKHNEALGEVGRGFLAAGGLAAVGIGLAVKASTDYGAKMAQLQSLSHASQQDMQRLSDAAMKQGQAFGQSATQVAEAEIELTKAGRDTSQILGGDLKGALALAAAGQLDVAQATQIGVTALTQFRASGATIPQVADSLAAGADKALGSVQDLGMALNQGGLVASQMGLDLNDTVGTLSAFAQAGLIGSDAGTSFKTMLLQLQSPSKQAADYLKEYNIQAYDVKGNFVGITNLAGQLQEAFKGKSQAERDAALSTIFGSDAIRAANVLYTEGAKGIGTWISAVDDTGFASAQAAGKMNSLQGDLTKLSAAFETDLVKAGTTADGSLRGLVQTATSLVEALGSVDPSVMSIAGALTVGVAGVGLFGGAVLTAVPKMAAFKFGLNELNLTGKQAAGVFGKGSLLVLGLSAAASGFAALAEQGTASEQQVSLAGESIKKKWGDVNSLFKGDGLQVQGGFAKALNAEQFGGAGAAKMLDGLTFGITHFSDVYKTHEGQFDALGQQLAGLAQQDLGRAQTQFAGLAEKFHLNADGTQRLLGLMPAYRAELIKQATAAGVSATDHNLLQIAQGKGAVAAKVLARSQEDAQKSADAQAAGIANLSGQAQDAASNLDDLEKAIEGFGSATLDARGAQRKLQQAIDDSTKTIRANAGAHGNATEAGRKNEDALDAIASAAVDAAAKTLHLTHNTADAAKQLQIGRDKFIENAKAAGYTASQAKDLADKLELIPKNVKTAIGFTGYDDASLQLQRYLALLNGVPRLLRTQLSVDQINSPNFNGTGPLITKAAGGPIFGDGPKGVDSVHALLAPGEHVFTAPEVDRMGGQGAVTAFRASLMGEVQAYAKGGPVGVVAKAQADVAAKKKAVENDENSVNLKEAAEKTAKKGAAKAAAQKALDVARARLASDQAKLTSAQDNLYQLQGGDYGDAGRKSDTANSKVGDARDDLNDQKAAADRAKTAADKAQKAYERAQDAAQKIHGKGTADEKHDAEVHVKELQRAAQAAKKRQDDAEKRESDAKDALDKATSAADDAKSRRTDLARSREDFVSDETRNPDRLTTDPLSYVDQLRQMSRDDNYSPARQKTFADAANKAEASLASLTKNADTAAKTLDDLQSSSKQLHDSVQQAVAGSYSLSTGYGKQQTSSMIIRDGIGYTTTAGGSASSIAGYYAAGAQTASQFADALKQLAGRGVNAGLLAELAQMGTEQGLPIAQALLQGSSTDLDSLNSSYDAIQAAGGSAGTTVADATFADQIAAADANAKQITDEITTQGEALRKIIATAFGLKGYATGTSFAEAGIRWVGEHGPELVGFAGGEKVLNAQQSRAWTRQVGGGGAMPKITVQAPVVQMPETITVQDASGFRVQMRVVAQQVVQEDAAQDAVLMMGGQVA
jgi:TP901 family phage tail tape measure protein